MDLKLYSYFTVTLQFYYGLCFNCVINFNNVLKLKNNNIDYSQDTSAFSFPKDL